MKTNEQMWLEQVVNVSIDRKTRKVFVHFRPIPLMEREYDVLEWMMREPNTEKTQQFSDIARGAFPRTVMVPVSSFYIILRNIKRVLVAHGANRGFIRTASKSSVQLYSPEPSVKVTAFHYPGARFTAGPEDGSLTPAASDIKPVWEGQITEKPDEQMLAQLFAYLNRDDRPNGRFAPSMSEGDIVTIASGKIEAVSYQAASGVRWIRLRQPVHADPEQVTAMKEKLTGAPQTVALS